MNGYASKSDFTTWITGLTHALLKGQNQPKVHDYTRLSHTIDYAFETIDSEGQSGYMTAQGKGVRKGDYIVLLQNGVRHHYWVQQLDYYMAPSDMWVALLKKAETGF